jgi:hypothetical protein
MNENVKRKFACIRPRVDHGRLASQQSLQK